MASQLLDELRKIPPVTRFLTLSTAAVTLPCLLKLLSPAWIVYVTDYVLQGELWRIPTSFFFGGGGITFAFDLIMLYRNSNQLESGLYAGRSADYAWHTFLASLSLLALNIPLRTYVHFRPLLLTLITLSSSVNPDMPISLFGLLSVQARWLPGAMLAMDLVMSGASEAVRSATGVIIGTGWGMVLRRGGQAPSAPAWVRRLVGTGVPAPAAAAPGTGGVVNPGRGRGRPEPVRPTTGGYNWGSGRRLGD